MQPPSWLKSSIIQQTRSSILSWLESKRDSLRNLKQKKWKKEKHELFALSFLIGFLSIPSAIAIDFSHFELFLSWKCLHLMKQTSPLPDAWCLWTLFLASADQYQLCSLSVCLQSLKLGSNEFFFHLKLSGAVWWNQQHLHLLLGFTCECCQAKYLSYLVVFNLLPIIEACQEGNACITNHSSHLHWCKLLETKWRSEIE